MWCVRLRLVVVCVWASAVLGCAGSDQEPEKREETSSSGSRTSVHYIYPRTGRLFHADYVRDNEIFRSLERTNFMRRGPFEVRKRSGRNIETEANNKKHVYVSGGRIPVEAKKNVLVKVKDIPEKSVLIKVSKVVVKDPVVQRAKRDTSLGQNHSTIDASVDSLKAPDLQVVRKENDVLTASPQISLLNQVNSVNNVTENKVDCDNNSTVKNNDTDKTLFVHDSTSQPEEAAPSVNLPVINKEDGNWMQETVVDDSLKLYPVYRGVKYYYPQTERRLVYSPQLTVQMDVPMVTGAEDEGNATTQLQDEGRSRRPLKKLAFPLLLALKLKTAIMVPVVLGLLGLISFKGLWSGLTALAIAAALGLKALVTGSGAKVLVQALPPPPPPPAHVHHLPPPAVEYAEYWSRRNDDHTSNYYSDYRPNSWS